MNGGAATPANASADALVCRGLAGSRTAAAFEQPLPLLSGRELDLPLPGFMLHCAIVSSDPNLVLEVRTNVALASSLVLVLVFSFLFADVLLFSYALLLVC